MRNTFYMLTSVQRGVRGRGTGRRSGLAILPGRKLSSTSPTMEWARNYAVQFTIFLAVE